MHQAHVIQRIALAGLLGLMLWAVGGKWNGAAAQQRPAPQPEVAQVCGPVGQVLSPDVLAPPVGLTAELVPYPSEQPIPGASGVRLRWQPVADAFCYHVSIAGPDSPDKDAGTIVVKAELTTVDSSMAPSAPGRYCYRVYAIGEGGHSQDSNQSCVDVGGATISYPAGWNLIAGFGTPAAALTGIDGPLYTYQPGDTGYEIVQASDAVLGDNGYWAYFDTATTERDPSGIVIPGARCLPAGQPIMIGNGSTIQTMSVGGADAAYVYDPVTATYQRTYVLQPGQGAWAFSASGGLLTFTPMGPGPQVFPSFASSAPTPLTIGCQASPSAAPPAPTCATADAAGEVAGSPIIFEEPVIDPATGRTEIDASNQPLWQPVVERGSDGICEVLTGASIEPGASITSNGGQVAVNVSLTPEGADLVCQATSQLIGKPLAISLNGQLATAPVVQSTIGCYGGGTFQISTASEDQAEQIVAALNGAAPPGQ